MDAIRVAAATDDGTTFVARHFGDAQHYGVYEVSRQGIRFLRLVTNKTAEEQGHADPEKARSVAAILQDEGVQVALTEAFGPNLKRIKSKFVCVLAGHHEITAGLEQVRRNFNEVVTEWKKGEQRDFLNMKNR